MKFYKNIQLFNKRFTKYDVIAILVSVGYGVFIRLVDTMELGLVAEFKILIITSIIFFLIVYRLPY
jgi:hypothetical protein